MRTLDRACTPPCSNAFRRLAHAIALAWGVTIDVEFGSTCPSVVNDSQLVHTFEQAAESVVGRNQIDPILNQVSAEKTFRSTSTGSPAP
jgi:metal-dependent amidase/aminoacylase/carboxypeptidase family protein